VVSPEGFFVPLLSFLAALGLSLQTASPIEAYRDCTSIEDATQRLACFDRAAEGDDALMARQARAAAPVIAAPAPEPVPEEADPLPIVPAPVAAGRLSEARAEAEAAEERARAAEEELKRLRAADRKKRREAEREEYTEAVVESALLADGRLAIRLESGEIWEQMTIGTDRFYERDLDEVKEATIQPAAFGGHWMKIEPIGERVKARLRD
jgi:hypothetical protein